MSQGGYRRYDPTPRQTPIRTNLAWAIAALLICFWPRGLWLSSTRSRREADCKSVTTRGCPLLTPGQDLVLDLFGGGLRARYRRLSKRVRLKLVGSAGGRDCDMGITTCASCRLA